MDDMAKIMKFVSPRKKVIEFDDFTDNRNEYNSFWTGMCSHCHNKFKKLLNHRVDNCGSGVCGVKGCENDAKYYVDFDENEVLFEEEKQNGCFTGMPSKD